MRILFTGASSFTGYWFVNELIKQGHSVLPIYRQPLTAYEGLRRQRIEHLYALTQTHPHCEFGSADFIQLLDQEQKIDLFCHHASQTTNYKSETFNYTEALAKNTHNLPQVLERLKEKGCNKVLLTGSVFEPGEGGSTTCAASAYGLSKGFTSQAFHLHTDRVGMRLQKFIIPNPFGIFEDLSRLTSFLIHSWQQGKIPTLQTPSYIRDNIPINLLAKAYVSFAQSSADSIRPSFYVGTQEAFAKRFAKEMEERLQINCQLIFQKQTQFSEPRIRINSDYLSPEEHQWDEKEFWNDLANYFENNY